MDKITVKTIENKSVWENFVLSKKPGSFLQSWNWGETNAKMGEKIFRLGFYKTNKLAGIMLVIKKNAKRGPHLIIPGGPIIDWHNEEIRNSFHKVTKELAKQEKVWFVRVRPELISDQESKSLFKQMGFVSAPMHLHAENTWILNIDKNEDQLLSEMRKNTRYSVRKSLRQDFELEITNDVNKAKVLYELQKQTVQRHGFVGFPLKIFEAQLETFGKDKQAALLMVKKGKKVHVAAIIIFYGDTAYYHHSASDEESRDNYAAYFLQWSVIQEAKKRGCKYYNLWGVAPDENSKKHRFYGVTVFKRGFGGSQLDWLHAQDLPVHPLYWSTFIFETGRRMMRGL